MAKYTIRVHHNETDDDAGETVEYEVSDKEYTPDEIRLRLQEAAGINLANLAASLERIANELQAIHLNV